MFKNKYLTFMVIGICLGTAWLPGPAGALDKIVAVVNNTIITQKDLDDFIHFMAVQLLREYPEDQVEQKILSLKNDLVQRLIEDRLILLEAKKNDIKIDSGRIKARMDEIRKKYQTEGEFNKALESQGLVLSDIESKIKDQLLMYSIIDDKIKSKIIINPAEMTDFYNKNIEQFKAPEERDFYSIITDNLDTAKNITRELGKNSDISSLVSKYTFKLNHMRVRKGGELRKEIEDVVFAMDSGKVSDPVKIEDNFYIFKLQSIIPPRQESFSQVQEKISRYLYDQKMQEKLLSWLEDLRKKAYIKIVD